MAQAVAARRSLPPIGQKFVLAGHEFHRTVTIDGGSVVHTDVEAKGKGLHHDGRPLGLMVGAEYPVSVVDFDADGAHHWLVFVPAGLQVHLHTSTGDRCTVMTDDLTGGQYWLVDDGDGNNQATTETATKGKPTRTTLAVWSD